jgi:hypothetical protein
MGLSRRDLMKKAGMAAEGTGFAGLSPSMANKAIGAGEERSERYAWITAAVAKHMVETLNRYDDGAFKIAHPLSAAAQACRSCHDKGSKLENTRAVTDCSGCHFTPTMKQEHSKF